MKYLALATDYDGTLAEDGRVNETTVTSLRKIIDSGRKIILVTGRELDELLEIFPAINLFEKVVAENGAVLYTPANKTEKLLCERPPEEFFLKLKAKGLERISFGRAIIATWKPFETVVLSTIRDMGLELQVIFNKDAVMVLPSGVNKATGLEAALKEMNISPENTAGIGDAENDHAFLKFCGYSASVSNALESLKKETDIVTKSARGEGVQDFINYLLDSDL